MSYFTLIIDYASNIIFFFNLARKVYIIKFTYYLEGTFNYDILRND